MNDRQLLNACLTDDDAAHDQLVDRYVPLLTNMLWELPETEQDRIINDTFETVINNPHLTDGPAGVCGAMFSVAVDLMPAA